MAGHLTLDEAAKALGISTDDFNKRLRSDPLFKTLDRGKIRDGASFRFKESAVKELARELGEGSDPGKNTRTVGPTTPSRGSPKVKPPEDEPLNLSGDDDDDPVFSLAADEPTSSGPKTSKIKRPDPAAEDDEDGLAIDFSGPASGVLQKPEGSSTKLSAPRSSTKLTSEVTGKNLAKPPKSGKIPPGGTGGSGTAGSDSEFELSLDAGSDSAFELKLSNDADDDDDALDLGEMPKDTIGGSRIGRGGESGILSRKPNDTGRSLERPKHKEPKIKGPKSGALPPLPGIGDGSEADVDFELTLDSGAGLSSTQLKGSNSNKNKKKLVTDSDSEFELTLDEPGSGSLEGAALGDSESEGSKGDIFETDFEIPPMDPSGSEVVTSDTTDVEESSESSETEGETEPSSSEVVLLEEDEEETPSPKARKSASKLADTEDEGDVDLADVDLEVEDDGSIGGALAGVSGKMRKEDLEEEEAEGVMVAAGAYRPVPWGVVPALFLLPSFALTLVGALMGFELLQTMWGYQQPRKPVAPIVREVAGQFDMGLKDQ